MCKLSGLFHTRVYAILHREREREKTDRERERQFQILTHA